MTGAQHIHFPCDISGHAIASNTNNSVYTGSPTSISASAYHDDHFITIDRTSWMRIGEQVKELSTHADDGDNISGGNYGGSCKGDCDNGFRFVVDTGIEKPIKKRKRSCAIVDIFAAIEDCEYSCKTSVGIAQNALDSFLDFVDPAGEEEHFYGMPIFHRYF